MLRRIQQTILDRGLIQPGMHIVAGVSGGADSTALLYVLWFLSGKMNFHLTAVHLHHGFRGKDADDDAFAVEQLCYRLRVPFVCRHEDVAKIWQRTGVSFEMAAREARQAFFKDIVAERKADAIAVAHTKNDQAETVLMRILTGTGPDGLGGIEYKNTPAPGLNVIRPLLDVSRESVEIFLKEHGIPWREDKTNRDSRYVRSRIRHIILPYIESKGFPHVSHSLVRLSEIMREEAECLDRQTDKLRQKCRSKKAAQELDIGKIKALSVAEQRRVVRSWLAGFQIGERAIEFNLVERILRLVNRNTNGDILINNRLRVVKSGKQLSCREHRKSLGIIDPVKLAVPGITELQAVGLKITVTRSHGFWKASSTIGSYPVTAYLGRSSDKAPDLMIRSRLPGDSIMPTGMKGRVFLKDLYINEKVPVEQRGVIPVLSVDDEVVWVAGYRVARSWAVPTDGAPSWKIVIEQKQR